jgi:hypothetical protein
MITLALLILVPILVMEIIGVWWFKFVVLGLIYCIIVCGTGFVLASSINLMFQGNEWFNELKAYEFHSFANDFANVHTGSFGWLVLGILLNIVLDILQVYWLYCTKFATTVTWIVNISCWWICYARISPYFYLLKKK